ncbi:MAG: hypothetical protein ACOC9X_04180 [bacterium]
MSHSVKVRLVGLPEDVEALAQLLRDRDETIILEESDDYPNLGKSMFVGRSVTVQLRVPHSKEDPYAD